MNEQNTGMMEESIIAEDNNFKLPDTEKKEDSKTSKLSTSPKPFFKKRDKLITFFQKPKTIILIICLFALIAVSSAILVISLKPKSQITQDPNIIITTPQPQNDKKTINAEIQKELDIFTNKVDNLQNKQIDFTPPNIDYKSLSSF